MSIQIGDKVRFLNSVGGGVVRGFRGKDQVLVEDEDGFEVPALIKECVVVGGNDMQVHSSNRPKRVSSVQSPSLKKTGDFRENFKSIKSSFIRVNLRLLLFLTTS